MEFGGEASDGHYRAWLQMTVVGILSRNLEFEGEGSMNGSKTRKLHRGKNVKMVIYLPLTS